MARRILKNYCRLSTIRLTPKDLFRRLLLHHAEACRAGGLDPTDLRDDEASNQALWHLLACGSRGLPEELVEALHLVDDLADEAGHDALLTESNGQAIDGGLGHLDPRALALKAWLDHRDVFLRAHRRRFNGIASRFREFTGREPARITMPDQEKVARLQGIFGEGFARRRRSSHCRIHVYSEGECVCFLVSHGRPVRSDEALEEPASLGEGPLLLRESWVAYRPQKHDLVVYDNRVARLKVNASDAATIRLYCEGFGEVLFGDRGWFVPGTVVSLGPLVELGRDALRPVPGIRSVELAAVMVRLDDDLHTTLSVGARDVFAVLQRYSPVELTDGRLTWAKLKIRYACGGRARKVEIRPPNQVEYDRRKHDLVTREFLEERGFLSGPPEQLATA